MKGYFNNPELKKSSAVLLFFIGIFLVLTTLIVKCEREKLKEGYIRDVGAITTRIIEKNPELEKDILPLITKEPSEKEVVKGKELLAQYGLTKELENELFPYIKNFAQRDNYILLAIFLFMAGILEAFNYVQYSVLYGRIRELTIAAKKVVCGQYDIAICEDKEGDFSKLALSFNSMRDIIRNNIATLKREKEFLVDLLSDISHQLKTPLSSMVLYNDLMLSKELSREQQKTFLINNQNQLQRMQWLITSLLKLAKLDANAIELAKEEESLNETIKDSIDALESKANEGKVTINFNEKEEVWFLQDKLWLEEALINIIKNGIEHTGEGGKINIELVENPVYRRIVIEDTGEGIREEDLPNIFKRFYKAKNSKKSDSVGIGLALAKSIVEAHGGTIEAYSKAGEGTRFAITLLKY